jgi:phosphoserine phosphatase
LSQFKLIAFDMDATLISIDEIADTLGLRAVVA